MPRDNAPSLFAAAPLPIAKLGAPETLACLRLIRSENVGPVTFRELINRYGGASEALRALPDITRRAAGKRALRLCSTEAAEAELAAARAAGAKVDLQGDLIQGGLVRGRTAADSRLTLDGAAIRVAADGRFLIGFGRDAPARMSLVERDVLDNRMVRQLSIAPRTYDVQKIDGLPGGIRLDSVQAAKDGVEITVKGSNVRLAG